MKLIDQARSNKRQAERDVQIYTQAHNVALANQKRAQNAIITVENRIVQIKSATDTLEDEIIDLRQRIDDAIAQTETLQKSKTEILDIIAKKERSKAKLVDQVEKTNTKLADTLKRLADQLAICQGIESSLKESIDELNVLKQQLNEIIRRR